MEILIQSALEKMKASEHTVHVRYWEWKGEPPGDSVNGEGSGGDPYNSNHSRITSYVIIHEEYSYLEPIIRAMFDAAEDVKVVVDRRRSDPLETAADDRRGDHPGLLERRRSSPMLDILIKIDG